MSDINIKISLQAEKAISNTDKLNKGLAKTQKNAASVRVGIDKTTSAFKVFAGNIASVAVSKLATGLVNLGSTFVQSARDMETLNTQFEILTGSAAQANETVQELLKFSASTPFQLAGIGQASQRLLGFGFAADDLVDKLQKIGDVAAASGTPIQELSLIFGQVSAAGKLTGERLLQLQERAIPIGAAIAKTMGVMESEVKDLVSAGKVGFAEFEKAFASLSQNGGFAFEGMIKRSKTLDGRISTLKDNMSLFAADVAAKLTPALKAGVTTLTLWIQEVQKSGVVQQALQEIMEQLPAAVEAIGTSVKVVAGVFNAFSAIIDGMQASISLSISVIVGYVEKVIQAGIAVAEFLNQDTSGLDSLREKVQFVKEGLIDFAAENAAAVQSTIENQIALSEVVDETTDSIVASLEKETAAALKQDTIDKDIKKKKTERIKKLSEWEKLTDDQRLKARQSFFQTATSLATSENKTLAAIGKAAALTQLAIKTPEAVGNSYTFGTGIGGPALGAVFGTIAGTAMAAQAAQIAGVGGFEQGGIVPGQSFSGDNLTANVNSGEMILNRQQQSELFSVAQGGGAGGRGNQDIVVHTTVELDGEAVGKSVSRQVADGLVLGENL